MQVLEFKLCSMNDGEATYGTVAIEQESNDGWRVVKTVEITSTDSARRLWFEANQRLVVRADVDSEVVMDPAQNVARREKRDMSLREALKTAREKIADLQAVEDRRRQLEALREADERSKRDAPNA